MYSNKYVLELIKDAIDDELKVGDFYSALSASVRDIDDSKMLGEICLDERKHMKMLEDVYNKLAEEDYMPKTSDEPALADDYIKNIESAISGEIKSAEGYRPLLFALENQQLKNYITEIMTDEQNHAAKLNYIYSKNK